ncbi:plasmid fertility inhibition factor family protein [Paraburkholderia sacchari]|uniref:plasmid fertility inhibition factor family protein n=1 Tax=Paraburkholderia sacchari TaxID=159450 RepID=UPI001BCA8118
MPQTSLSTPTEMPSIPSPPLQSASGPFWIVPVPGHHPYDHVRLKRVFATYGTRHEVVVVDLYKLLVCADRDDTDYVLKPVDDWHLGKVRGIREFLDPRNERVPQMLYVTIVKRRVAGLAGWLGFAHEGVVAFRNGQHRARYLSWAGAQWLPVEVHQREAPLLRELCGAVGLEDSGRGAASGPA